MSCFCATLRQAVPQVWGFRGKCTTLTSLWCTVEGPEEALWFGVSLCQGHGLSCRLNDVTDSVTGRNARSDPSSQASRYSGDFPAKEAAYAVLKG